MDHLEYFLQVFGSIKFKTVSIKKKQVEVKQQIFSFEKKNEGLERLNTWYIS